jgi:hypothetical protein
MHINCAHDLRQLGARRNCHCSRNREMSRSEDRLFGRTGDGAGWEPSQRPYYRTSHPAVGSRSIQSREGKAKLQIRRLARLPTLYGALLDHLQVRHAHHPLAPSRRGGRGVDEVVRCSERTGVGGLAPLLGKEGPEGGCCKQSAGTAHWLFAGARRRQLPLPHSKAPAALGSTAVPLSEFRLDHPIN